MKIGLIYEQHREFSKAVDSYKNAIKALGEENKEQKWQLYVFLARTLQCMNKYEESYDVYNL